MGNQLADQYSFLHFCVGAIAYYWQLSLRDAIILHLIFELTENTQLGIKFINKFFVREGGKDKADSPINIVGDNISFILGWFTAQKLDVIGSQRKWYVRHIPRPTAQ